MAKIEISRNTSHADLTRRALILETQGDFATPSRMSMSLADIKQYIQPPDQELAYAAAKDVIDARFTSIDALDELETLVLEFQNRQQDLVARVSVLLPVSISNT